MPEQEAETRECPYCKEDVKADAIRCKYYMRRSRRLDPPTRGSARSARKTSRLTPSAASIATPTSGPGSGRA